MFKKIDYGSMSDHDFLLLKKKYDDKNMRLAKIKTVLLAALLILQVLLLGMIISLVQAGPH